MVLRSGFFALAFSAVLTGVGSFDAVAGAGAADPNAIELELGHDSERPVELPVLTPDLSADTTQALREIESRPKAESAARPDQGAPARLPDLDPDVTQGIQSRELNRILGR